MRGVVVVHLPQVQPKVYHEHLAAWVLLLYRGYFYAVLRLEQLKKMVESEIESSVETLEVIRVRGEGPSVRFLDVLQLEVYL